MVVAIVSVEPDFLPYSWDYAEDYEEANAASITNLLRYKNCVLKASSLLSFYDQETDSGHIDLGHDRHMNNLAYSSCRRLPDNIDHEHLFHESNFEAESGNNAEVSEVKSEETEQYLHKLWREVDDVSLASLRKNVMILTWTLNPAKDFVLEKAT